MTTSRRKENPKDQQWTGKGGLIAEIDFLTLAQKVPDRVLVCGKGNVMNDTNLIIDDQGGQFNLGIYNQLGIIQSVPRSPIPQNSNSSVT